MRPQHLPLHRLEGGAGLHQAKPLGIQETGNAGGGAQGVRHQGAAAGTELDQREGGRAARAQPIVGAPEADQLAEHLADFRRRDEIAAAAQRVASAVIAVFGMQQGQRHIVSQADRALAADAPGDDILERRHAGLWALRAALRALSASQMPKAIIGRHSSCPMVRPSSGKGFSKPGWRTNSTKKRERA